VTAVQSLEFGSPLGIWIQFTLILSVLVLASLVVGRRSVRVGAPLAGLAVLLAWLVSGRSFHRAETTDHEVALHYPIPPRVVRLPAETIAGATWRPWYKGAWVLDVTTRGGGRYTSIVVGRGRMEALEPRVIQSPLGVSR